MMFTHKSERHIYRLMSDFMLTVADRAVRTRKCASLMDKMTFLHSRTDFLQ